MNNTRWTDDHRRYVGGFWDEAAQSAMKALTGLGMRPEHRLLDVGCGSFRIGRKLVEFLEPGKYVGIEPVGWVVEKALEKEAGLKEMLTEKGAVIERMKAHEVGSLPGLFDFVLVHGIFHHASLDYCKEILRAVHGKIRDGGILLANFRPGREDRNKDRWSYPAGRKHDPDILRREAGLIFSGTVSVREGHFKKGNLWMVAR